MCQEGQSVKSRDSAFPRYWLATTGPNSLVACSTRGRIGAGSSCVSFDRQADQNAYVESFNGKFRDECLNEHWFLSVAEAQQIIEAWRIDYNTVRRIARSGS